MGRSILGYVGAVAGLTVLFAACGSSKSSDPPGSGDNQGGEGSDPTSCAPNTKRCDGRDVVLCGVDGKTETVELTCAEGLRCRQDGTNASCDTRACTPGQPLCDGNFATTCDANGAGPKPGGTSCAGQMCMAGKCTAVSCDGGEQLCSNGDLYSCSEDGKSITLVQDCISGTVCDSDQGKCLRSVCTPNQATCQGTTAKTCNAFGTDFTDSVDCADDELNCVAGKCTKQICVPAQRSCKDDNVVQCSLSGEELTLSQTCNHSSEHCEESSGGFAFCFADVCTPGKVGCEKNMVKTCNEQGFYPTDGEDCGDGWCMDGECQERNCEVGTYFCQDASIHYCQDQAPPVLYQECEAGTQCRAAGAVSTVDFPVSIFCGEPNCEAGATVCFANQVGKCASDGESLVQVTDDCEAAGEVCGSDATCAATAVDSVGEAETIAPLSNETFTGNLIEVTATRKLTQLRSYLLFPSARQLRWVVYEETGTAFVAKADKVSSVASSTGFVTSPAFNYQLTAGKRYLVGLAVSGGDVSTYYDGVPYEPRSSFGLVFGIFNGTYTGRYEYLDNFYHDSVMQIELTTALP